MMNFMIHTPHQNSSTCGIAGVCWVNLRKGQLGMPVYRWDDDLKGIGREGVDWMNLAKTGAVGGLLWKW